MQEKPGWNGRLPNGEKAIVDIGKLTGYCLNPLHPRGRHKAKVFAATVGIDLRDAEMLRTFLLKAAREADAALGEKDEFGQRYVIDFPMAGPKGNATVRSSWILLDGEIAPRFISCYVI